MKFCMFYWIAGATACLIAGVDAHAADPVLPRAWLVSNGKAQAVLVAEAHVGNPVEQDAYYDTVVQPSYLAADVAVMETYMGAQERGNEAFERGAPCTSAPGERRTEQLAPAFDALAAAMQASGLPAPNWLTNWPIIPEFLFTSTFLPTLATQTLGADYDKAIETHLGPGTSFRLRALGGSARKTIGLNLLKDQRADFCSASAASRQDFLVEHIWQTAHILRTRQADPTYARLGELRASFGRAVAADVRCVDRPTACPLDMAPDDMRLLREHGMMFSYSPGVIDISLRRRTRAWLPIIVRAMAQHRRTFIIVGSRHVRDISIEGRREPGLISHLRQRGYTVSAITAPANIAGFLQPSWSDRLRTFRTFLERF